MAFSTEQTVVSVVVAVVLLGYVHVVADLSLAYALLADLVALLLAFGAGEAVDGRV